MKKKLYRRCDFCKKTGVAGVDVFWTIDPYAQDIQGEIVKVWLHVACCEDLAREI
jgi:hypothetical protein